MLKTKFTLNVIGYVVAIVACIMIFNHEANAGKGWRGNEIIGYTNNSGEAVTYGQYYTFVETKEPSLVEYCKAKGLLAMSVFNERETKSFEDILKEIQDNDNHRDQADQLEYERIARDVTRKDNGTDEWVLPNDITAIEEYANGELSNCIVQGF